VYFQRVTRFRITRIGNLRAFRETNPGMHMVGALDR
jgi:hypothetical protein